MRRARRERGATLIDRQVSWASSGGKVPDLFVGTPDSVRQRLKSLRPRLDALRCSGLARSGKVGCMKVNRATPPASVVPVLSYPDVRTAVAWLSAAFGFVERTRIGESHRAQMSIGADGAVIVAELRGEKPEREEPATHLIRVRVENAGAEFERARAHGARVVEPPTDREYGERDCTLEDLAGHRWQFAETIRDVAPEEFGCQTVAPWPNHTDA
jgi:uncharacterized glyoxalase superfamily protein PhnB